MSPRTRLANTLGVLALALFGAGCSAIPAAGDPTQDVELKALAGRGAPSLGRLAIAPLTSLTLSSEEHEKGWRPQGDVAFRHRDFDKVLLSSLNTGASFEEVSSIPGGTLAEAYAERADYLLRVQLTNLRSEYEGRNGWWIPNIVNWVFWMVPAWWVATEDFTLSAEAELTILSAESGAILAREVVEAQSSGSFDEFDRGWHFFGFVYTPLDPERWLRISSLLFPDLRRRLAVQVALRSDALLRGLDQGEFQEQRRKTLVTAVGLSQYADPHKRPELAHASDDARGFSASMVGRGIDSSRVQTLISGAATVAALRSTVATQLARANPGDNFVLYFSGYGSRDATGKPVLLLYDSDGSEGALSLEDLAAELQAYPGQKLVIVDASFDRGRRAIQVSGGAAPREPQLPPDVAFLLAASPGEPALSGEYLGHGLMTHRLLQVLAEPRTDANGDGRIDGPELYAAVREGVVAEGALLGARQRPRLLGSGRAFLPVAPSTRRAP